MQSGPDNTNTRHHVHPARVRRLSRAAAAPGGAGSGNAVWADDAGVGTTSAAEPLLGFLTAR